MKVPAVYIPLQKYQCYPNQNSRVISLISKLKPIFRVNDVVFSDYGIDGIANPRPVARISFFGIGGGGGGRGGATSRDVTNYFCRNERPSKFRRQKCFRRSEGNLSPLSSADDPWGFPGGGGGWGWGRRWRAMRIVEDLGREW